VNDKKKEGRGQPEISGEKNASSVTLRAHLKRELLHTSPFLPFIFFSHEQSFHGRRPKGGRPRGRNGDRYIERNAGKKSGSTTRRSVNNVQLYILSILSILSILNHHKAGTHARTILLAISSMSSLPTVA